MSTARSVDPAPPILDATAGSGLDSTATGFNEHVFYDVTAVARVADAIADRLGSAAPALRAEFTANAAAFTTALAALDTDITALGARYPGTRVIVTEAVPGYLVQTLGFTDITPPTFAAAVEAGAEISVRDLADTSAPVVVPDGDAAVRQRADRWPGGRPTHCHRPRCRGRRRGRVGDAARRRRPLSRPG